MITTTDTEATKTVTLADRIRELVEDVERIYTRHAATEAAGIADALASEEEKRAKARTPVARHLAAAAVHLRRAGGPVPDLARGLRVSAGELQTALVALAEAGRG